MSVLIPTDSWRQEFPRRETAPIFEQSERGAQAVLALRSAGGAFAFGKWLADVAQVPPPGHAVRFRARAAASGGATASAVLTWLGRDDKVLSREYAAARREGGSVDIACDLAVPEGVEALRVELIFRCSGAGAVEFTGVALEDAGPRRPRPVRLSTAYVAFEGKPNYERNFERNLEDVECAIIRAGQTKPDIIVLTENIYDKRMGGPLIDRCITLPSAPFDRIAALAKRFRTYLVFSVHEREGDMLYNTAVLVDRQGNIAGKYRKTHLTLAELEEGLTPGEELPVFETDLGTIGILVCWDHWFPEVARILCLKGAEVLCVPSAGFIDSQSRALAASNGCYVVTSCVGGPESCRIIGPQGDVLACVEPGADAVTIEVDLNEKSYQHWLSVGDTLGECRGIFMNERRPALYRALIAP